MRFMLLNKTERLLFISSLFTAKRSFAETAIHAECSMFYECELYDVESFGRELCNILRVCSPYPERKVNVEYLQLTLF